MSRFIAILVTLTLSVNALADPISIETKSGILLTDKDETVDINEPGLWINNEARAIVQKTIVQLEGQNAQLREMVLKSVGAVPFLPQWASVVISASLAVLTAVATFFAVKEAANTIK